MAIITGTKKPDYIDTILVTAGVIGGRATGGADQIAGGGNDVETGGAGADVFVSSAGKDIVTDFSPTTPRDALIDFEEKR